MSKRAIILTVIASPFVLFAGAVALVNLNMPEPVKEYAFTDLGARCATGAISYTTKVQSLATQSEKDNVAIQAEIAKTQSSSESNATYNTSGLNDVHASYLAIYNQGGMTHEEYSDKVTQLDQAQATSGTPSSSIQSELNRIQTEAGKHYDESKKKVADMQASATKLTSCTSSAKAHQQFTAGDVAVFEALIAGS